MPDDIQATKTIKIVSTDRKAAESLVYGAILAAGPAIKNERKDQQEQHEYQQEQRWPRKMVAHFEYISHGDGGNHPTGNNNKRDFINLAAKIPLIPTERDDQPGDSANAEDLFPVNTKLTIGNNKNQTLEPEIVTFEWVDAGDRESAGAFLQNFGQTEHVIFLLEAAQLEERSADAASRPSQLTDTIEIITAMGDIEGSFPRIGIGIYGIEYNLALALQDYIYPEGYTQNRFFGLSLRELLSVPPNPEDYTPLKWLSATYTKISRMHTILSNFPPNLRQRIRIWPLSFAGIWGPAWQLNYDIDSGNAHYGREGGQTDVKNRNVSYAKTLPSTPSNWRPIGSTEMLFSHLAEHPNKLGLHPDGINKHARMLDPPRSAAERQKAYAS